MHELNFNFGEVDEKSISFVAVGDVMFSRDVKANANKYGVEYFFKDCGEILQKSDIAFCNFESPITDYNVPSKYSRSNFKTPPNFIKTIAKYFDIVSLANNHIYDYCVKGAKDSVTYLKNEQIESIGVGESIQDARKPIIISVKNLTIGFLAYTCLPTIKEYSDEYPVSVYDEIALKDEVKNLKEKVDVCIISLHGGHELISYVEPSFIKKAKYAIDCGADLILGHHTHVISGIEIYRNKPIVYSLGNFIFDNPIIPERKESFLLSAKLDKINGVTSLSILPLLINDDFVPTIAKGDIFTRIINKINDFNNYLLNGLNNELYWKSASKRFLKNGRENLTVSFYNLGFKGILTMLTRLRTKHFKLLVLSIKNKLLKN